MANHVVATVADARRPAEEGGICRRRALSPPPLLQRHRFLPIIKPPYLFSGWGAYAFFLEGRIDLVEDG